MDVIAVSIFYCGVNPFYIYFMFSPDMPNFSFPILYEDAELERDRGDYRS
jgi:hypothetical protein